MRFVAALLVLAITGPASVWGAIEHRCRFTGAFLQVEECPCADDVSTQDAASGTCCDVVRSDDVVIPVATVEASARIDQPPLLVAVADLSAALTVAPPAVRRAPARAAPPPAATPIFLRTRSLLI